MKNVQIVGNISFLYFASVNMIFRSCQAKTFKALGIKTDLYVYNFAYSALLQLL